MGKLFSGVIVIAAAAVAYGYWDAHAQTSADGDLRARVITPWSLFHDSHAAYSPVDNGQLFVEVTWKQPDDGRRISAIHVKGRVVDGDEVVAAVDAPCLRAGSPWLGGGKWTWGTSVSTDPVCFIRIDKILSPTDADGLIKWPQAEARIAKMKVEYTAQVKAVNKPMRYVTWINDLASGAYGYAHGLYEAVMSPFERA